MAVRILDGSGNVLTSTGGALDLNLKTSGITLPVSFAGSVPVTGTFWQATQPVSLASTTITGSVAVTGSFYPYSLGQQLAANSVPMVLTAAQITTLTPPAAITGFALETGGNLATIVTNTNKIPSLGQALAASSVPVVLTSAQLTTLTPPAVFNGVVTNAGTFAVQAACSGTVAFSNTTIAVTNTGTFAVQAAATLNAETTKVIGVVRTADGSGNLLTSTTNALDVNIKTGSIANTSFIATQATAANLNALVTPAGSTFWQASPTSSANTVTNPFFNAITDGTNGKVAVKAASTASVATDIALVVTQPGSTTAGACANTVVNSTSASVLSANTARREVTIVNTDVVVVYLGFGQTPTATTYHIALSPCATAHDGTGGTYTSDIWKGAINAIVTSTSGHIAITELT